MPSELAGDSGNELRERGNEYGTTTGRPRRCGWFDVVGGRYSVLLNGYDEIVLTKLDVISGLPRVKLCVAYELDGKRITSFPQNTDDLAKCTPVYEEMPGWGAEELKVDSYDALPANARNFIERIEKGIGARVSFISTGAATGETRSSGTGSIRLTERDEIAILHSLVMDRAVGRGFDKLRNQWAASSGRLEHLPFKQGVLGSSPRRLTFHLGIYQSIKSARSSEQVLDRSPARLLDAKKTRFPCICPLSFHSSIACDFPSELGPEVQIGILLLNLSFTCTTLDSSQWRKVTMERNISKCMEKKGGGSHEEIGDTHVCYSHFGCSYGMRRRCHNNRC